MQPNPRAPSEPSPPSALTQRHVGRMARVARLSQRMRARVPHPRDIPWTLLARRVPALARWQPIWQHATRWLRALVLLLLVYMWLLAISLRRLLQITRAHLALWRQSPRATAAHAARSTVRCARTLWPACLANLARAETWLSLRADRIVARGASAIRQMRAFAHGQHQSVPAMLDDLESDDPDTPLVWELRLSGRARLARLAVIGGTLCLALFLITGGPTAALAEWRQVATALTPAQPPPPLPPHLNASYWVAGRLPNSAIFAHGIQLQPSPADSQVAYACWITHDNDPSRPPTMKLYATADGARNWEPLAVPSNSAAACRLVTDALDPQRLLLVMIPPATSTCAPARVFDTPDRGATWQPVMLPTAILATCDLSFALWQGIIYLWSPTAQSQLADVPASQLLVTTDDGTTWRQALDSPERQPGTVVSFVSAAANGELVVLARPALTAGRTTDVAQATLWCRPSIAAPWQTLGPLPNETSAAFVVQDAHSTTSCHFNTIYAAGFLARDDPTITRIEARTGGVWRIVPPLPLNGSVDFPLTGDGDILGVGPDGVLLADTEYMGAAFGLTSGGSVPARAFWGWDPRSSDWLPDFHPTPVNTSIEGFAWDYGATPSAPRLICWIFTLNAGIPAFTGVLRATFATASAPAQDAYSTKLFGQ